ncbi:Receptor guanylate cyclase [Operophtera brumata]|uniref:Receptor guanylate cyclase n=1 Tax=Operophtera brumata TaxID=104452 RepID=A0A0L7LPZ8_OPEBR|nr:Receptor guanylate cyclase [Operophtera brumata]
MVSASVARITKFLGSTGLPIITTGGFTFDFVKPKVTCKDEFYMLVRAGPLGFEDLAHFIIDLMRQ